MRIGGIFALGMTALLLQGCGKPYVYTPKTAGEVPATINRAVMGLGEQLVSIGGYTNARIYKVDGLSASGDVVQLSPGPHTLQLLLATGALLGKNANGSSSMSLDAKAGERYTLKAERLGDTDAHKVWVENSQGKEVAELFFGVKTTYQPYMSYRPAR